MEVAFYKNVARMALITFIGYGVLKAQALEVGYLATESYPDGAEPVVMETNRIKKIHSRLIETNAEK